MIALAGLLRNKKGMDYSAFLVLVVFIAVIYLFIQLYSKMDVFELRVGDNELALMNAYESGDEFLLFADQSAKYSVYRAVGDLAGHGGFVSGREPCGSLSFANLKYSLWFKGGNKCYSGVNFYDSFDYYLSKNLDSFLSKGVYSVGGGDFEFTVADDRVIGVALRPVLVPVAVSADKKKFYGNVLSEVQADLGRPVAGLGAYVVRPSFSVGVPARISDYGLLQSKVDVLLDCVKTGSLDSCVRSSNSDEFRWSYQHVPGANSFVFDIRQSKFANPFEKNPVYIRFAMDLPGVRVQ
jgi:hypothetical protein